MKKNEWRMEGIENGRIRQSEDKNKEEENSR